MPNLINNPGNLTDVAANYRRNFAPFTRFGTRQLGFFEISLDLSNNTLTDEELNDQPNPYFEPHSEIEYQRDGYFQRAIQAIETRAEIYAVFRPGSYYNGTNGEEPNDGNTFIVQLAVDTANVGSDNDPRDVTYNANSGSIAEAVSMACDCYVEVTQMRLRGSYFRYSDLNGLAITDRTQAVKSTAGTKRQG
jgi:hypothetical protein